MYTFTADQTKNYIIYGAGGNCRKLIALLQKQGGHISCVIDQRAASIGEIENVPVVTLQDFQCNQTPQDNLVFIISIKNVYEHHNIALQLLKMGFHNIIYKPMPTLQGISDKEWDSISSAHDWFLVKESFPDKDFCIAQSNADHMVAAKDAFLINKEKDLITCYAPIELVCNYNTEDAYGKLQMAAFYPMINLYKFLLGNLPYMTWEEVKNDFWLYAAEWIRAAGEHYTEELKDSLFISRLGIFQEMQKMSGLNHDFFIRNAVEVEPGDNMQLYLKTSGRNRVAFMIAKGFRFVPVKMAESDYEKWRNKLMADKVLEYMSQNYITKTYAILPHPTLATYQADIPDYERLFCMPVINRINRYLHWNALDSRYDYPTVDNEVFKRHKSTFHIYVDLDDNGTMARCLAIGKLYCLRRKSSDKMTVLLDQMLYFEHSKYLMDSECNEDISNCQVIITDLQDRDGLRYKHLSADIVYTMVSAQEEKEQLLIQQGYHMNKVLFESVWSNQLVRCMEWRR